ncbi:MAG: sigma-70 family RNA polymerase sigma factor [Bacteroidota bacterium]
MKSLESQYLALIDQHQGLIHKVCHLYCQEAELREDLFQEILLQLWKAYPSFRGDSSFSTWMYRIALNTAIALYRKQKKSPLISDLDSVVENLQGKEVPYEEKENQHFLYQAIYTLNDVEKAIILLYLESYKYEEIAEIMGISVNLVGVKINRIKQRLKNKLSHLV